MSIRRMYLFIILLVYYGVSTVESQVSIPKKLKECYVNNNVQNFHLPMNMRVLLDIIRKVERESYATMDIRTMSSSLLHRFKFDGIEHYEDIQERDGILPYGQSGKQSVRSRLIKEMVPGKPDIFPFDALTTIESCTLHQAISNTIMKENSRDINPLCQEIGQKLIGRSLFTELWNCPREYGVILTSYGTIAPGVIIAAIAASLQHQNIELNEIFNITDTAHAERPSVTESTDYSEQVDFIIPKSEMIHDRSMSYSSIQKSEIKLDNVWLTTIAGDLAEMVVYQGPILGIDMELGATGFWNNTMHPNVYYLKNKDGHFDATRAEIVGDIDGLILASHIQDWVDKFNSIRLSQIFDMYYSNEGVTLLNENVKICDRRKAFPYAAPKIFLEEQTYIVSDILAYENSITFKSPEILGRYVNAAVDKFSVYANDHLLTESLCRATKHYPQVEALIAFNGAWTKEYTTDFISVLIDDLDVSIYGSKMGIIHGTSGEWLLNITDSPSLVYHTISNFTKISWPTHLNLVVTLNAVYSYLNETWETKWQEYTVGSLGQVVIILAPVIKIAEIDQQIILKLLKEIKDFHPDVNFLYYVSQHNFHSFQPFILSEHDRLITSPYIESITKFVLTVPRTLRPTPKSTPESSEFKDEMEDYISPSKSITYMLHPQYIDKKKTTISVHNFGYGTIKACSWNQLKIADDHEHETCQQLDAHKAITLIDEFICTDAGGCPYIYLRVQNVTSFNKCAEIECRLPNQVRYIIRMQNTNSANQIFLNIFLIFYLYPLTILII